MKVIKYFNSSGGLIGIILADVVLIGSKNNFSYSMETTHKELTGDFPKQVNEYLCQLIKDLRDNMECTEGIIPQLEHFIV